MYKKNSINKIKKQHHTYKRTKKRSYGKSSNKRTQNYGYYTKNNKITKKRVYNKKKKGLVGGASGVAVPAPKIMISTKNKYLYLIPVLNYLQKTNLFVNGYIDVIYANGNFQMYEKETINKNLQFLNNYNKPTDIFKEAGKMNSLPFIVYIDDNNEIMYEKPFPKKFTFSLYSYQKYDKDKLIPIVKEYSLAQLKEDINIEYLNQIKSSSESSKLGLCLCIQLPSDETSICNFKYFYLIIQLFKNIREVFNNNLLTVFDFDNTLTKLHLFKSIDNTEKEFEQYTDNKKKEFTTAFLNPSNNDDKLKEAEINKYFGEGNIQKILELFEIIKRPLRPPKPKAPAPTSAPAPAPKAQTSAPPAPPPPETAPKAQTATQSFNPFSQSPKEQTLEEKRKQLETELIQNLEKLDEFLIHLEISFDKTKIKANIEELNSLKEKTNYTKAEKTMIGEFIKNKFTFNNFNNPVLENAMENIIRLLTDINKLYLPLETNTNISKQYKTLNSTLTYDLKIKLNNIIEDYKKIVKSKDILQPQYKQIYSKIILIIYMSKNISTTRKTISDFVLSFVKTQSLLEKYTEFVEITKKAEDS